MHINEKTNSSAFKQCTQHTSCMCTAGLVTRLLELARDEDLGIGVCVFVCVFVFVCSVCVCTYLCILSTILTLSLHVLLVLCQYSLALSLLHTFTPHTHAGGFPGDLTCKVTLEETQVILRDCRKAEIGRQDTDTQTNGERWSESEREKAHTHTRVHTSMYTCLHSNAQQAPTLYATNDAGSLLLIPMIYSCDNTKACQRADML